MKIKLLVFLVLFAFGSLLSQGKASFSPEKPVLNDLLKIKYDPSGTKLSVSSAISAEVLAVKEMEPPQYHEINLVKKVNQWTGDFKISEKDCRMLLIKFTDGKNTDDNNENVWDVFVYGKDKKALNSACDSRGTVYAYGDFYGFKKKKDLDKALSDFETEIKNYPGSWRSYTSMWRIILRRNPGEESNNKIKSKINELYEVNQNNEEAVMALAPYFEQIGEKEKSEKIRSEAMEKNPKGVIAKNSLMRNAYGEKNAEKRNALLEKLISDFDLKSYEKVNILMSIVSFYAKEKNWEKVQELTLGNKLQDGSLYVLAASRMMNDSSVFEKGMEMVKKGIELLSKPEADMKPSYMSNKEWKEQQSYYLNDAKHTYAKGLIKTSKYDEAGKILSEIYSMESENKSDYGMTLIDCYIKSAKYDKAFDLSQEIIEKYGTVEGITEKFKEAYGKVKGSEDGFDSLLDSLKNSAKKSAKEKLLKELVNKPAPQFELKDLDGKIVKLADLKGKVVVVDFWATWCGPCKSSFPFLQKVYEKYKSNPDIMILALNTWERVKGEEKEKQVKKFIADNKYTFPVLYDDNFVEQYGVTGIPTKFIIDKEGNIQFKSIGFNGGEQMIDEMDMMFDILLKGEHKK